jgi:hypothetical protein
MKEKVIALMAVMIMPIAIGIGVAGEPASCNDKLRQATAMLDITRSGRDQAELSMADLFGKYQDAIKQIEDLKAKLPKEALEGK